MSRRGDDIGGAVLGDTGNPEERFGEEPELTPEELDALELANHPDRADPEFWEAFGDRLNELCELAGEPANFENMIECMRLNWKALVNEEQTKRQFKEHRLRQLRDEKQKRVDTEAQLDADIEELEREVGR